MGIAIKKGSTAAIGSTSRNDSRADVPACARRDGPYTGAAQSAGVKHQSIARLFLRQTLEAHDSQAFDDMQVSLSHSQAREVSRREKQGQGRKEWASADSLINNKQIVGWSCSWSPSASLHRLSVSNSQFRCHFHLRRLLSPAPDTPFASRGLLLICVSRRAFFAFYSSDDGLHLK